MLEREEVPKKGEEKRHVGRPRMGTMKTRKHSWLPLFSQFLSVFWVLDMNCENVLAYDLVLDNPTCLNILEVKTVAQNCTKMLITVLPI